MVKRSKLLQTLDFHKGRDYDAEKRKKVAKSAEKKKDERKRKRVEAGEADEDEDENSESEVKEAEIGEEDSSDEDVQKAEGDVSENKDKEPDEEADEEEEEEEEDIPLSDLSDEEREDVIPHQRLTINNTAAINASLKRISFITPQTPFSEHNSLISPAPLDVPDPNDDLNRELAFYKVCQAAADRARAALKKEDIPFTRPGDYFAEMVKTDEHMGRIKKKLYDEAASKKAAAEARKQRDLKRFGKQVQVAKLQQRSKEKRETLEKIDALKKKRKSDSAGGQTDDTQGLFDVAIDDATKADLKKRGSGGAADKSGPSKKRQKKDEKFGFGGKKRHAKSGDASSSGDLRSFSVKKMKTGGGGGGAGAKKGAAGPKRPGKSKRAAGKGRS
ncbi:Rrna processing protein [Aspergillus sp. HF37]|nr:Rrna processing protein [Aspergillus sp. HF37]